MRRLPFLAFTLLLIGTAFAQGPAFNQSDLWTLPYEDLSDLMRHYPGMYPQDIGTLGAPMIFRPWGMNPWLLQVDKDGIPQNRRMDGLYLSNLQPAAELDSIRYNFMRGGPLGRFDLFTRRLPVDTPYTELQIREGYYGYGTVDFAHAQRAYRSLTLELTGRLVWYRGMRTPPVYGGNSASRFNRLRALIGLDIGSRWRGELTYAGSNVRSDFVLNEQGVYNERSEGIFSVVEKDSSRSVWRPSVSFYLRQDREAWGDPFQARELTGGWVLGVRVPVPGQTLTLRQLGSRSDINFPGFPEAHELALHLEATDSLNVGFGLLLLQGKYGRISERLYGRESDKEWLGQAGATLSTRPVQGISLHGGIHYVEDLTPIAWRRGIYSIADRPLLVSPELSDLQLTYNPTLGPLPGDMDRYLKGLAGLRWSRDRTNIQVDLMAQRSMGSFIDAFASTGTTAYMFQHYSENDPTQLGASASASIPLPLSMRLDNWWFAQTSSNDPGKLTDSRGYSRLLFEHDYFTAPLTVRAHVGYEFIGERDAYSNYGVYTLGPSHVIGFRISGTIRGVTLMWGTENFLNETYAILPGYRMIGKEEYLQFIWRIWL